MAKNYNWHYVPTGTGTIDGLSVMRQTEDAINDIGNLSLESQEGAQSAINIANEAKTIAGEAQGNANNALVISQAAKDQVDTIRTIVDGWDADVKNAVQTSTEAKDLAQQAIDIASNAGGDSTVAIDTANEAKALAQQADAKADTAITTANEANTKADNAVNTATSADVKATNAETTANQAAQTAESNRLTAYSFRSINQALSQGETFSQDLLDPQGNIKAGDSVLDTKGVVWVIDSVDNSVNPPTATLEDDVGITYAYQPPLATQDQIETGADVEAYLNPKQLKDYYASIDYVDEKVSTVFRYKGAVATVADLPTTGNVAGDVYNVTETDANYAWDGTAWDKLSETIDLTGYLTSAEAQETYLSKTSAQSTYLTINNASATYLSKVDATGTYLTIANAGLTYMPLTGGAFTGDVSGVSFSATTFNGALNGNASTATKATQDASGNVITTTYATVTALGNKADKATTLSGYGITDAVNTTSAQTIAGVKTFSSSPIVPTQAKGTANTTAASTAFVNEALSDVSTPIFTGATSSAAGTSGSVPAPASNKIGAVLRGDGTWGASVGFITSSSRDKSYAFVLTDDIVESYISGDTYIKRDMGYFDGLSFNPVQKTITAPGGFIGNATTATTAETATKAAQDGNGAVIATTYAKLDSPDLTGTPTAPTAAAGTNTTQIATTAFVQSAMSSGGQVQANWDTTDSTSPSYIQNKPTVFKGATTSAAGTMGFVPAPEAYSSGMFLKGNGQWGGVGVYFIETSRDENLPFVVATTTTDSGEACSLDYRANLFKASGLFINPAQGKITATTFVGKLEGQATTAVSDSSGNNISTTYAPKNSPAFTGIPTAETAVAGTNTAQLATTAFVQTALGSKANLDSPAFTGAPTAPTPAAGTGNTQIATTAWAVPKAGNRGTLTGYETIGTNGSGAQTLSQDSFDSLLITSSSATITVVNGAAGTAWIKTVFLSASTTSTTVSLASSWVWAGGSAPTLSARGVLTFAWGGTFGIATFLASS